MVHPVKTELFASRAPLSWASVGNGILFTAQIPIDASGEVVDGGIEAQTRQTLDNLVHTLACAGGGVASLTQVLIYVTRREDLATVNRSTPSTSPSPIPTARR